MVKKLTMDEKAARQKRRAVRRIDGEVYQEPGPIPLSRQSRRKIAAIQMEKKGIRNKNNRVGLRKKNYKGPIEQRHPRSYFSQNWETFVIPKKVR